MTSTFVSLFRKRLGCPTSESLLEYHRGDIDQARRVNIEAHLATCEFCNAELQLLGRLQSSRDDYSFAEMPRHLRQLAQQLLKANVTIRRRLSTS